MRVWKSTYSQFFLALECFKLTKRDPTLTFKARALLFFLCLITPLAHVYLKLDYKQINVNEVSECVNLQSLEVFLEDNCMEEKSFEALYCRKRLKKLTSDLD